MSWTEEKVNKLKELWGKGNTASQIAEIIGGISRNAVIGKAHRLNLSAKIKTRNATTNQNFENTLEEKNLVDRFFTTTPEYQRIQSFESDLADAIQKGASESEIKIAEQRLEKEKERIDKVYQRAKEDIVEERNRGNFETVKKEYNDAIRRNEELTLRSL